MTAETPAGVASTQAVRPGRQIAMITLVAIAIFWGMLLLPTGTNLSHMDFRVNAKNSIEFCDPLNPQFIPVVAVRSPVVMTLATAATPAAGAAVSGVVMLRTASGKGVVPEDLLVTHTEMLHLLIVDPTLTDYQHVHPKPAKKPGEWNFSYTPRLAGTYRIFSDFTPAATGRGLYSSVDLVVRGVLTDSTPDLRGGGRIGREGLVFTLQTAPQPVRAGQPADLRFAIERATGGAVGLEPVMGAFAHLVAFDEARSGFAHLHPAELDLLKPPDATKPVLNFKLTIPRAGRYVVWAQIKVAGRELFVPFALAVSE
jgi:hypothetical protein